MRRIQTLTAHELIHTGIVSRNILITAVAQFICPFVTSGRTAYSYYYLNYPANKSHMYAASYYG